MGLNTDFQNAIDNIVTLAAKLDTFINGNTSATVSTTNGPVKSIANIVAEVGSLVISDNAITTAKLLDLAVTSAKIADSTITAAKLANDAVTTVKLADLAITTGKMADLAITAAKIADSTITAGKLANDAVTTDKVQNGAITLAKLAAGVTKIKNQWQTTNFTANNYTTITPLDNTIPLVTEGSEIFNLSISPTSTGDTLDITITVGFTCTVATSVIISLFVNSDTCYAAYAQTVAVGAYTYGTARFPGIPITATGTQAVRVRIGPAAAATVRLNSIAAGGALFGGVLASTLTVQQVTA